MSTIDPPLLKGFDSSDNPLIQRQIDAGNISYQDLSRFNDPQWQSFRNYPSYGASAGTGAAAGYLYIRRIRAPSKIFGLLLAGSFAGFTAGSIQAKRTLKKNLQSLDNPEGFTKAMTLIIREKVGKMGIELPKAAVHAKKGAGATGANNSQEEQNASGQAMMDDSQAVDWGKEEGNTVSSAPADDSSPTEPESRTSTWDAIRASRSTAQPTSWDTIRQTHEKQKIAAQKASNSTVPSRQSEGNTEQQKFDAMLEAERRASTENADPYAAPTPSTSKRWT